MTVNIYRKSMTKLNSDFYKRDALIIARELIGKYLVREIDGHKLVGMITETEAYKSMDKACHAYNYNLTKRTSTMFKAGGVAYIYFTYGMYHCFNVVTDIEGELLESYYPGLGDIPTKQFIAMTPQMSSVVNELVFLEAETEEDAEKAAEILQKRIDDQAAGGAWYPESMEAWGRGQVIQEGTYVAMIASAEHQEEIADAFEGLFA